MALQHAGEAVLHLRAGGAHDQRARHIGGAIAILAARIDEIDTVVGNRQVGFVAHPVMRQGGVGAGGRNGVERQIFQAVGLGAELAQPLGGAEFIQPALGRLAVEPGQEACQRRTVAHMRGGGAGDFGGVLDRAWQHGRVARFDDAGTAGSQRVENGGDA